MCPCRHRALVVSLSVVAGLLVAAGCDSAGSPVSPDSLTLSIVGGNFQVGTAGRAGAPLAVRVLDEQGAPVQGAAVAFAAVTGPARDVVGIRDTDVVLDAAEAFSDADGIASVGVRFGETAGGARVAARIVDGTDRPRYFHVWAYPELGPSERALAVLSFNDFHMHLEPWGDLAYPVGGLARLAGLLLAMRSANDAGGVATAVFNAGDDFENTLFHDQPGAFEALLRTWDRVGVDVWQVGNHDFHFGVPFLTDRIRTVVDSFSASVKGHPMVLTWGNVDASTLRADLLSYADDFETGFADVADERLYQQATVLDLDGLRVGVFGAVTDAAIYIQVPGDPAFLKVMGGASPDAQGMTFLDPDPRGSDYVSQAIDHLDAQGAHLIVANSHAGLGFGDRVNIPDGKDEHIAREGIGAESGRSVDLIVSGHSHVQLDHAIFIDNPAAGRTGIVQGLEGGVFVTRSDLVVDTATGAVTWIDSRLVQVDDTVPEDETTAATVAELSAQLDTRLPHRKEAVAVAETFLSSRERTYCGLGHLINAAFLDTVAELGPDIVSFVVPSTYRTDIHPGPIDLDLTYKVLSMHKMDDEGTHEDSVTYVTVRPGLFDLSFLNLPATRREGVTAVAYLAEIVHSFEEVLGEAIPAAAENLKLEVVQMGGVSYELDATAPAFGRVVPDSLRVGGSPPDPDRSYVIVGAHSIVTTFARVLDSFILATDAETGEPVDSIVVPDPETGEPFTDTGIALYESLYDYLSTNLAPGSPLPAELVTMSGAPALPLQPDLMVNPTDIRFTPTSARPGDAVEIAVTVRNNGVASVSAAPLALYLETTPWDRTDDPDGFAVLEGKAADAADSRLAIGSAELAVDGHPATVVRNFVWRVPSDLPAGRYPIEARLSAVTSTETDPNTGAPYEEYTAANNGGRQSARVLEVAD